MLKIDPVPHRRRRWSRPSRRLFELSAAEDRAPGEALEPRRRARRSSPCAANTPAAAGPSGRRASSSAPPSCSSTPPATSASWRSAATPRVERMASHVTHVGVHDHGFNNVSTYGNLLRLMREGRIARGRLGAPLLRAGAEGRAARCRRRAGRGSAPDLGYIYSFNGPHSLFADTIRSLRALAVAHQLGHVLMGEGDQPHLAARAAARSTRRPPRASTSTSARAATPTTCAGAWPTSRSST